MERATVVWQGSWWVGPGDPEVLYVCVCVCVCMCDHVGQLT